MQQIGAETPLPHRLAEFPVGAADQLERTGIFPVGTERQKHFFLDGAQQHRLFVEAQFADFIQEENPLIRRFQQAGPIFDRAGKRTFDMAEQCRHRLVAAQRGAVDFDETAADLPVHLLQLVNAFGQPGFAGAGGTAQQQWFPGADGDPFDGFDQRIEAPVAGGDAGFEKIEVIFPLDGKTFGQQVVTRQIEVDDRISAARAVAPGRLRLDEPARQVM